MSSKNQTKQSPTEITFPQNVGRMGNAAARFAPSEKPKNAAIIIKRLVFFYAKEGKMLVFVLLLLLISTLVLLYVPRMIGQAVNAISSLDKASPNYTAITTTGIIIICAYIIDWLSSTMQGLVMATASQKIVQSLRTSLFAKIQKLPLTYLDTRTHGEIMSRLTNDIDNISSTIAASTSNLMNSLIMVIGSVAFMIYLSPILALVTLVTFPLVFLLTRTIAKRSRKMFLGQQRELGILNGIIEETIGGLRMVKAFNQEKSMISKFSETNKKLLQHSTKAQIWAGFLMPLMNVISNLGYVFVAAVGGILAVKGYITIGVIASFITYSRLFVRPLNDIAGTFNSIQSALAGAERVFDILNEQEEKIDIPNAEELTNPKGVVKFENVSFSYANDIKVLKNINFKVERGQTIALVGKTGAGKTTIVNLLTRFYDTTDGTIYIDGRDIREYKRESLMRAFTVVLQDTCLFTGTIADNIRYGKPEATMDEIIAASKLANSDRFIRRLPQSYETEVSGAIDSLSQGQRQLVAIARAVLCSAPLLILDEATSSVDTSTELKIQEALLRFRKGRTSFVIAHRLSTIKDADKILVVDNGEIIESGTHEELLQLNGTYSNMYESQYVQQPIIQ